MHDAAIIRRARGQALTVNHENPKALHTHPRLGASWEGFLIEQLSNQARDDACVWATHQGAEIDLISRRGDRLLGVECKRVEAPRKTGSIGIALEDLGLERVAVETPDTRTSTPTSAPSRTT